MIFIENVKEIQQWGQLDEKGYPIKERKGEGYKKLIYSIKGLDYDFVMNILINEMAVFAI